MNSSNIGSKGHHQSSTQELPIHSNEKKFNNFTGVNINSSLTQQPEIKHDVFKSEAASQPQVPLPAYVLTQMRKDLINSSDVHHLIRILKAVRGMLKRSCGESKKARKDTFKLLFTHFDIFSILSPASRLHN